MKSVVRSSAMLAVLLGFSILSCAGQTSGAGTTVKPPETDKFDLGVTFDYKFAKISTTTPTFGMPGAGIDGVYWLGDAKRWGLAFDINGEAKSNIEPNVNLTQITFVGGPRYTIWQQKSKPHGANIYGEVLGGYVHAFDSVFPKTPVVGSTANSFSLQAGGGVNLPIAKRIDLRLIEADYIMTKLPNNADNLQNDARLSAGLVFRLGVSAPAVVTLGCSASPSSIFAGDPVAVTATAGGLDSKDSVVYSWAGDGVTGKGATASVATGALAPGTYTVNCGVKEGKAGHEGLKAWEVANSTATFTVKAFEPPTISCSANPTTVMPGGTSTITSVGMSPQNRPLSYSYSASGGSVSGSGTTATFSSAGAATGAVGITCNVSDDKGHSATANTTVTIEAPPAPPQPHASALCALSFSTDIKRPTRVDNEAKACLDQVALDLKQQSDAKLVIVGESNAKEKAATAKQQKLAAHRKHMTVEEFDAQRAVNAKEYLVTDEGIDASRISVATGVTDGETAEDYLVPAGANFSSDVSGTTPVDESMVKAETRKPLPMRAHSKKK